MVKNLCSRWFIIWNYDSHAPSSHVPFCRPLVGAQTAAKACRMENSLRDSGLVKRNLSGDCQRQMLVVLGPQRWHPESSVEMQTLWLPASLPVTPMGVSTGQALNRKGDQGSQTQIHYSMDVTRQHGHITGSADGGYGKEPFICQAVI